MALQIRDQSHMTSQEAMAAALDKACMAIALQIGAELDALYPTLQVAHDSGIHDVSAIVPAWFNEAVGRLGQGDQLNWAAYCVALAEEHAERMANAPLNYQEQAATGASVAAHLGVTLKEFTLAYWTQAIAGVRAAA